jgi:hypothetical protein
MIYGVLFVVFVCGCGYSLCDIRKNVALHAQVFPSKDKIVGSVITTSGLKSVFQKRFDINEVEVFYPANYIGFLNRTWDLVLIEGWFPSIDLFIRLTRNNFPFAKIVFICLDPTYPGLDTVHSFDVDGILTNSMQLVSYFEGTFSVEYMQLAADPHLFQPIPQETRDWGAVYVGAGGPMLQYKPALYEVLIASVPFGLRLHGKGWEVVPRLSSVTLGILPQDDLSNAYNSAHIVLASTIESQSTYNMVNNRIFEALSCGNVIVSTYSKALEDLNCSAIMFANDAQSVTAILDSVLYWNPEKAERLRVNARQFILNGHTWAHRVVQIMSFYERISCAGSAAHGCPAPRQPSLEWKLATLSNLQDGETNVCDDDPTKPCGTSSTGFQAQEGDCGVGVIGIGGRVCQGTNQCTRSNCPSLLWLIGSDIANLHIDYLQVIRPAVAKHLCQTHRITVQLVQSETDLVEHSAPRDGKVVVFSLDQVNYIRTFDVVLGFIEPFSLLDMAMRSLPQTVLSNGMVQRRVAYIVQYKPQLVERRISQLCSDRDMGTETPCIVPREWLINFEHYDSVWFRSHLDLRSFQQLGVVIDPKRLQHIFGLGEFSSLAEDGNRVWNTSVHRGPKIVWVCYFNFAHLCTNSNRDVPVQDFVLLLLGGSWAEWAQSTSLVHERLAQVLHVPVSVFAERGSDTFKLAVQIVQGAEVVLLLHGPSASHDPAMCDSDDDSDGDAVTAENGDIGVYKKLQKVLSCQLRARIGADELVLWPFVAAAVSSTRIHLLHSNAYFTDAVQSGCMDWSSDYARETAKLGMDRLLGFGPATSAVHPTQVMYNSVPSSSHITRQEQFYFCDESLAQVSSSKNNGFSLCDNQDQAMFAAINANIAMEQVAGVGAAGGTTVLGIVRLQYQDFTVGSEGECCIEVTRDAAQVASLDGSNAQVLTAGRIKTGRLCLMRSFRYLFITMKSNVSCIYRDANSLYFSFELRGSFYGDVFYNNSLLFQPGISPSMQFAQDFDEMWLETNSIFVYDINFCN